MGFARRTLLLAALCIAALLCCASCGSEEAGQESTADAVLGDGKEVLRIVSGSENRSWRTFWASTRIRKGSALR